MVLRRMMVAATRLVGFLPALLANRAAVLQLHSPEYGRRASAFWRAQLRSAEIRSRPVTRSRREIQWKCGATEWKRSPVACDSSWWAQLFHQGRMRHYHQMGGVLLSRTRPTMAHLMVTRSVIAEMS